MKPLALGKTPFSLTQLVVVRRDMRPQVQLSIQGGHAIGIATFLYTLKLQSEGHTAAQHGTADPRWGHPYRMWCCVQNEKHLRDFAVCLDKAGIYYTLVEEPDDESGLKGQATALCTLPYEKEELLPLRGNTVFDLKFENVPSFKEAAIAYVVKQLSAQLPKEKP